MDGAWKSALGRNLGRLSGQLGDGWEGSYVGRWVYMCGCRVGVACLDIHNEGFLHCVANTHTPPCVDSYTKGIDI